MHEPRAHDPKSGLPDEPRPLVGRSGLSWLTAALSALLFAGCGDELAPANQPDSTDTSSETTTPDTSVEPDVDPQLTLVVTSITPAEGRTAGLEEVTLTGRGLSKVVQVRIGDAAAVDPFAVSDTLLVALTPPNARGLYDVTVIDDLGKSYTLPMAYKYVEPVQVISAEPAVGTALGGERVVIYGAGFGRDAVVLIGGRRAVSTRFVDTNTLEVVTPEGAPGKVDVHVSGTGGSGRLRRGFEYLDAGLPAAGFRVTSVSPNSGPSEGGTRITLEGSGFSAGLAVHVGALPATSVEVVSSTRITATTAAGSPGPATVRVIGSGTIASLADAFTYTGPPELWVVNPPTGSVSGGTRVKLLGAGFPSRGEVSFGGVLARDVVFVSDTEILATTPGQAVGAVPVTIRSMDLDQPLTRPDAFVYFDPAANPGTWGDPVDGTLNITVQDARAGTRVAGAFVMLGASPATRYRGYTDNNGQITFSGDDLIGDQVVSASFTGYQTFQLAGFDAENVTLPLEKAWTCADIADMPCDSVVPPPVSAIVILDVVGSAKGPTMPFGACADWPDASGGHCAACAEDADCGGEAHLCRELGSEGSFCTTPCVADTDCQGGFVCLDPSGLERERRCVPPPGTPATYCDLTETELLSQQAFYYPGVWVPPSNRVQMNSRLGDFAAYCWDGVEVRGNFRPHAMGITRQLGAYRDGEVVEAEVRIDIPLGREVDIELERPTFGNVRDELATLTIGLNLGGDGFVEFPPQLAFTPRTFTVNVPSVSSAELYDARWELYAEVTVNSINGGSAIYEMGLPRLDHEIDYVRGEDGWAPFVSPLVSTRGLALWRDGDGRETAVAVGEDGRILKRFGTTWAIMPTDLGGQLGPELLSVATANAVGPTTQAIVGGNAGLALHWNGLRWERMETGVSGPLDAIAFADGKVAWAVAGKDILRFDGDAWQVVARAEQRLFAVLPLDGARAIVAGELGTLVEVVDGVLGALDSGTNQTLRALVALDGTLFAAGDAGVIVSGPLAGPFAPEASGTGYDLKALAVHDGGLWAVGSRATILRKTEAGWSKQSPTASKGTLRAVLPVGDEVLAMGSHEFVLGPMLGIPENLTPPPGSSLSRLSWQAREGADADFTVIEWGGEVGPCSACGMLFMLPYTAWRSVLDGDLFAADFPNLRGIANTAIESSGVRGVTLYRVKTEDGFDFDHTASSGFYGGLWKAWAWRTEAFLR